MRLGGSLWKESSMSGRNIEICDISDIRSGIYDMMHDLSNYDKWYMMYILYIYIYTYRYIYKCTHDI